MTFSEHHRVDGGKGELAIVFKTPERVDRYGVPIVSGYTKLLYLANQVLEYNIEDGTYEVRKNRYIGSGHKQTIPFDKITTSTEILYMNDSIGKEDLLTNYLINQRNPNILRDKKFFKFKIDNIEHPELYLAALTS